MTQPHQNPFGHNPFDPSTPAGRSAAQPHGHAQPMSSGGGEPNTLATLSLVFAFVFAPAGAILGHLGLAQITRTRQPGRERALVGVTLSYVVITAAVVALIVWAALGHNGTEAPGLPPASTVAAAPSTTTTTPPPPPTVAPADLAGLLPTVEDAGRITGNPNLSVTQTYTRVDPDVGVVDPERCWSAEFVASAHAYDASTVTGVSGNDIRDHTNPRFDPFGVTQSVAAFHDARAARRQLDTLTGQWRQCAGATVHRTSTNGDHTTYVFDQVITESNGITTIGYRQTDPPSSQTLLIVRAVAAKANIVVDLLMGSCRAAGSQHDAALALTNFILDKIPGPR